jgi:site-specific DNA-cytosine methylase
MKKTYRIAHIFCGIGGKGLGAKEALAQFGEHEATFETIGGIDFDAQACRDFEMLVGAPTLCADVHQLEPADLLAFFGPESPDVVMMSPPCKGYSGLLSAKRAREDKYQRMNMLMERALFLVCATWKRPPKLIFVENVPRIMSRGRDTIGRCVAMGHAHGYAIAQGTHNCGELGALAQNRMRYFMLWRHREQVPQFVYEPPKHRVRACGEVLGPLPMPGDVETAGPMHKVPKLSWRNWLRLALIPAGGDWRDLPGVLEDGQKRREQFRRAPVTEWAQPAETITGPGGSAAAAVADPRVAELVAIGCEPRAGAYGVLDPAAAAPTITASYGVDNAPAAIADDRVRELVELPPSDGRHCTQIRCDPARLGRRWRFGVRLGGCRLERAVVADPRRRGSRRWRVASEQRQLYASRIRASPTARRRTGSRSRASPRGLRRHRR